MNPDISVIVATRNRSHVLRVALDGISAQSCLSREILVVDDGSNPEEAVSNRALVEAAGGRYEYLAGNPHRGSGPSFPRNRGIALAQSDLIAFCDDDDQWTDVEHLQSCVDLFSGNQALDLVFANQEDHLNGVAILTLRLPRLADALSVGIRDTGAGFAVPIKYRFLQYFPHLNTCVFRKTVLQSTGGLWEEVNYTEDMDLYVRVADIAREVVYRNKTVAIHNVPDPKLAAGASTRLREAEKQLAIAHVAQHLLVTCHSAEALHFACALGGEAMRILALEVRKTGGAMSALNLARAGLAHRFSYKWALFTCYLQLKVLIARFT